jgi:AcrR family transcriptional regulator
MSGKSRAAMMEETRAKLISAGRKAFAEKGFADASMDDLTADAGLTRGALYHNFGDKKGLLAAVVAQVDGEMAAKARQAASGAEDTWAALEAEGAAYIELALDPEIQRIVLLDGPAVLGDPSAWPSQNACLVETRRALIALAEEGRLKPVDIEAAARLLNGAALNAALYVAASTEPKETLPRTVEAFKELARGFLAT